MITTTGRLLGNFNVDFINGEIRISYVKLEPDEQVAILIDRWNNKARLYAPFEACQRLALHHHYELVMPEEDDEEEKKGFIEKLLEGITRPTD